MDARVVAWAYVLTTITVVVKATSKIDCNDGKFYIRADPDSCSHFYKCDNGRPVRFTCPSGLYFNPDIYVCDWPYNVKCSINGNQGQSSNNNQAGHNSGYDHGAKYNGYDDYHDQEEQHYDNDKFSNNGYTGNEASNTPYYVVTAPEEGPSVQDPYGPLERPRPKVDDNQSANNHPYNQYVENDIDIR